MINLKLKQMARLMSGFLFLSVLSGCQDKIEKQQVQEIIPVKVEKIVLSDFNEVIEYVGNIKAQDEAVVYPKVSGKVSEKLKEDGAVVKKGEAVAYIDRDEVGLKFERAPVESPLSGIVGRFYADIGQNVGPQTSIALVVNMEKIKIDLDVPEKHLSRVLLGQEALIAVDAYPEEEFLGKVTKISPIVDLSTRAAPIQITVDNQAGKLKSGMFARVRLIVQQHKDVPVILKEAVLGKVPTLYVYVVENQKAVLRNIVLGIRQGAYFEVLKGIKAGDMVVIMGQQKLYDNAPVSVEQEKS
jgi:membrane fusion protein, multidrug efflux system